MDVAIFLLYSLESHSYEFVRFEQVERHGKNIIDCLLNVIFNKFAIFNNFQIVFITRAVFNYF